VRGKPANVERLLIADNLTVRVVRGPVYSLRPVVPSRVEHLKLAFGTNSCSDSALQTAGGWIRDERGRNLTLNLLAPVVLCVLARGLRKVELTT
jgi:hypothetical protein